MDQYTADPLSGSGSRGLTSAGQPSGRIVRSDAEGDDCSEKACSEKGSGGEIIAACGNDCAACPRYNAAPYEKTGEELRRTAELWMKIGYRDSVVSNEEIACAGCRPENMCRYNVVSCCIDRGVASCGRCPEYPCDNIRRCFAVTKSFEPMCRKVCTEEEFLRLKKAFFEKEKNLDRIKAGGS